MVSGGLEENRMLSLAIGKAKKLSTLLLSSRIFKEEFEMVFGQNKGIPAIVCTRWWNSTLHQISAITSLSHQALCDLLEDQVHKELKFSAMDGGVSCKNWSLCYSHFLKQPTRHRVKRLCNH